MQAVLIVITLKDIHILTIESDQTMTVKRHLNPLSPSVLQMILVRNWDV